MKPISRKTALQSITLENAVDILQRIEPIGPEEQAERIALEGVLGFLVDRAELSNERWGCTCLPPGLARRFARAGFQLAEQREPQTEKEGFYDNFGPVLDPEQDAHWQGIESCWYRISWPKKEPA